MTDEQKLRLLQEYLDLNRKCKKLYAFITTHKTDPELDCDISVLKDQLFNMERYRDILKYRLTKIGIEIDL